MSQMMLTSEQVTNYREQGYVLLPDCFNQQEVSAINHAYAEVLSQPSPARVLEKDGETVRSVYGSHTSHAVLDRLARHPRLVNLSRQILEGDVYIHQFKVNAKAAFGGDLWEWHQDYVFWHYEDGMPAPRVINVLVFLDEVTEFNGPLMLIPRSHREGIISTNDTDDGSASMEPAPESWTQHVSAKLKYSLSKDVIRRMVLQHGIVAPKGGPGSVLLFDPNICHGSATNMSPFDRRIAIVTYNHVNNRPTNTENLRPEFLSARGREAITPVADDALTV
jgi:ectoine hydroxylase